MKKTISILAILLITLSANAQEKQTLKQAVKKDAQAVGNAAEKGADATKKGVKKGANWVGDKSKKGAKAVEKTYKDVKADIKK